MFKLRDIFKSKGSRKGEEPWLSPYCGCVGVIVVDGLEYACTACGYEGVLEETGD